MPPFSAVIITYNEQNFIGKCLSSLEGIAEEIIVVDSFSTDSTEEICRKYNVKFVKHEFEGYVEQKNFALTLASYPHILSLDADEALSDELVKSILAIKERFDYDGYIFNRLNNYCGHWMKYSRLYPDKQLRLFDSRKGKWIGPNPHDRFMMDKGCKTVKIKGDLLHWNFNSYEEHIEKMNKFSTIGALEAFKAGRKSGPFTAIFHSSWSFFRSYILKAGFLDGYYGYVSCSITAYSSFMKYVKLRRLNLNNPLNSGTENEF
ncbi:MAG: glycosyltransferase family 2 protein [Odoribacter sp.]|nr:glycosyltransferase family 2 protein [Odoribacter sp.]